MTEKLSECCNASVTLEICDETPIGTEYYLCSKCLQPCTIASKPKYSLNCSQCGCVYPSSEGFPKLQFCPKCSGSLYSSKPETITDGFGSEAPTVCPTCHRKAVYVCRPGDIRCHVCYDHNNPEEYELIQSKPDASPDRLLSRKEFSLITGLSEDAEYMYDAALPELKAQDAKTYPLAFETGKKLGMTPEQVKAHGDICYEAGKLEGKKEQVEKDRQEIERLQTRLETIINDLPEEVWHEFIEEVGSFYRHCKYCDYSSNPEEHNSSICSKRLQQSIADAKKQGAKELAEWVENWAENTGHSDVQLQAKIRELL